MSLRARLTLWFLVLAILPSLVLSLVVLQQLVSTVEWWDSAGVETSLTSSVSVAKTSLKRLESSLRLSAAPLFELSRQRTLVLVPGAPDRLFIERYLRDTGLDLYQVYARTPPDTTWRLQAEVAPVDMVRPMPLDLSPELNDGRVSTARPMVQSVTGVFALLAPLPADSTRGAESGAAPGAAPGAPPRTERLVAAGFALPEDFFLSLSELQLGLGIFRRLSVYAQVYKWYFRIALAATLVVVAGIAILAARALASHLARPIAHMADTFARVDVDSATPVTIEPKGAPEVRRLAESFNAMTLRLSATRQQLARAEREAAWQGVARQVAHEIKNPLTTIGLALYNMEQDFAGLGGEARGRVERSLNALRRELDSLDDLADSFSTLGRLPDIQHAAVEVNTLVDSVVALSPWEHVTIETQLDPARPVALGDERQLRRVLRNLVKNACEAQPGGGRVTIATGRAPEGQRVTITVIDDGPGITPEVAARIFDFGFSTKNRGSGVGLTVSRRVIEQHGGTIAVDRAPGRGARVTFTLPAFERPSA